jgi:glycine/D-amino acid oxidase-like deaminating enzyme
MRAEIHSPAYHGGLWDRTGSALVHPGKLALGLRRGALEAGVRLQEHSAASERFGGPVSPRLDDHEPTFARLSQHLFTTFPQLDGLRFSYRWGGAIDTCSRFCVFFGTSHGGRVSYATGYTGLGVAATRLGGRVALDLADGRSTAATRLRFVREKPLPFPPEPLRSAGIRLTVNRLGVGFDS